MSEESIYWRIVVLALGASLIGCVVVPPRNGLARVHVGDVVKRIKCDLASVVYNKAQEQTPDGRYPFEFLSNWAAKIHLTIAIDDSVTLSPGATITNALDKTVATTLVPATTEFFSLGVGVSGTTEAIRTEDIEFLVSFSDMLTEFGKPSWHKLYNNCYFDSGLLLESDLGLAELVNSALDPIESGVLYQGNNVGPGVNAVQIPTDQLNNISAQLKKLKSVTGELPKPPPDLSITDLGKNNSQFNALIRQFNIPNDQISKSENQFKHEGQQQPDKVTSVKTILTYQNDAATEEARTQAIINNIVKPMYSIATESLNAKCLADVTQSQFKAITWSARVSLNVIKVDKAITEKDAQEALKAVKDAKNKVIDAATDMISQIAVCSGKHIRQQAKGPPQYDPIDVISETVNFFITVSGSVTPQWKLVKVTAPLAPTLFSGTRKDTNTLILAMGRPAPSQTVPGGITGSNAMNNQVLAALLSQAIINQRLGP